MKKHSYRTQSITELKLDPLRQQVRGRPLVVSIDVAKEVWVAALITADSRQVQVLVKWHHPEQTAAFFALVERELPWSSLAVVLEPSGSYGDPLRSWFSSRGHAVFRVSPKRCHDAAEVYDGVASLHDAKAAIVIGRLHLDGASERWPEAEPAQRALRAKIKAMELYADTFHRALNRLEGQLGRYWPELTVHLELGSVTLLELLGAFGSPQQVAAHAEAARALMRWAGGAQRQEETLEAVMACAATTVGVACLEAERAHGQRLAREARRTQQAAMAAKQAVESAGQDEPCIRAMASVVGKRTAVVLFCLLGPPTRYASAASYLKAMGLNLKERSSGKHKGRLMLTQRGSGTVRRYLFLAVLRLIQRDPLVQQWYRHKIDRDGGHLRMKAVVAVMRKLARALWHVAQGQPFEAAKLFDANHLRAYSS